MFLITILQCTIKLCSTKDIMYEVVYKDEEKGSIVDEVKEKELVYAASCPVTVSGSSEDESEIEEVEGTVLLSKPSPDDPKSIQYTVMLPVGGSYARYEDGIDAKRIKYRKEVLVPNTKSGECDLAQSGRKDPQPQDPSSLTRNKHSNPPVLLHDGEGGTPVPSSISCRSIGKVSNDIGITITSSEDSGRSGLEIKIPFWLQRDRAAQLNIFFHLIGSARAEMRGKRTVKDIERETHCNIRVNFTDNKEQGPVIPITVSVMPRCYSSGAQDMHFAREKIQELLLDYVGNDGSRGQLLYELALSVEGPHRSKDSPNEVVRAYDPFTEDRREVYMTVFRLPYVYGDNGRKRFHASHLLKQHLLNHLWTTTGCYIKACINLPGMIPVKRCFPYLLVMGDMWQNLDMAVALMKEANRAHVQSCSCHNIYDDNSRAL